MTRTYINDEAFNFERQLSNKELKDIENKVMAHRYLYYVECNPILPDANYDALERDARRVLPLDSPVQRIGSDLSDDYSEEIVELANSYL